MPAALSRTTASTTCARSPTTLPGGVVDLSIGTPCDPPPAAVVEALGVVGHRAGLPAVGRHARLPGGRRRLARPPLRRRRSTPPHAGGLRRHQGARGRRARTGCGCARPTATRCSTRAVSYPTYAMGATLAGCRAVPVRARSTEIDPADAERALCLWVNSPGNPTGELDDLGAAAAWGRAHGVPGAVGRVLRRVHLGRARAARSSPTASTGVLAVHSLSKRSNLAGRPGRLLRRRPRPGPLPVRGAQARRVHGARARCRPRPSSRSTTTPTSTTSASATARRLGAAGRRAARRSASTCPLPGGAFYLWVPAPDGDAWALARAPGRRGRRASCRRASSTARPAPATCASRWCSPTTASSWWPSGWR